MRAILPQLIACILLCGLAHGQVFHGCSTCSVGCPSKCSRSSSDDSGGSSASRTRPKNNVGELHASPPRTNIPDAQYSPDYVRRQLDGENTSSNDPPAVDTSSIVLKGLDSAPGTTDLHADLPDQRIYVNSGNALVLGTSWIIGHNVQNSDPALIAKSRQMFEQEWNLAYPHAPAVDFGRYNFVIGIAESTSVFSDLSRRVVFDNFSNGSFSSEYQALYNSLKGREFGELGCHSNGAMVCLAALENGHVRAHRVVLYGPQLTRESIDFWQQLLRKHQIDSLDIFVNEGDPVPPFSIAFGDLFRNLRSDVALLTVAVLKQIIHQEGPAISVHTFSCSDVPTLDCHDMSMYKTNRGCLSMPSSTPVPGTLLPGKGGVDPPPPPC